MREPPSLKPGDAVAVAAPSATFDKRAFLRGLKILREWGLKPIYREDIFSRHRYFAGNDRRRYQELQGYLEQPDLKAILFARGGFGLHAILPKLRFRGLKRYPKRLIAYSDLTMLLNRVNCEVSLLTYYGPTVCQLGRNRSPSLQRQFKKVLFGSQVPRRWSLKSGHVIRSGRAEGKLIGGCLTLLSMSIGTPFEIQTRGGLLLLEDTGEEVYRIERMLVHLIQVGKLRGVRGVIISDLNNGSPRSVWVRMLRDVLADFSGPIVYGLRFGHCRNPHILPLGCSAVLSTQGGFLKRVS